MYFGVSPTLPMSERWCSDTIPPSGVGNSAPVIEYAYVGAQAVASTLVLANMNSLPLDWATRLSVGGVNMNFFIVKQLPVLPPEAYLEEARPGLTWAELVVPRVLELTYTAQDLAAFARDLGYDGPILPLGTRSAATASSASSTPSSPTCTQLDRAELEYILDAPEPSVSFPGLKRSEMREFGEYPHPALRAPSLRPDGPGRASRPWPRTPIGELTDVVCWYQMQYHTG